MHGFPYDIHAYAEVAPLLARAGCRVIVPYLRGYGATRFLSDDTPRSGEQAALGADLLALMDALAIDRARCSPATTGAAAPPASWRRCGPSAAPAWSRSTATTSRTSRGAMAARHAGERAQPLVPVLLPQRARPRRPGAGPARLCRLLWQLWSPTWTFDDATFERSAAAFDNPDFVDVVIHSYRHRFGLVPGDPAYADDRAPRWRRSRPSPCRRITFDGADDGVRPPAAPSHHAHRFTGPRSHRMCPASATTCRRRRRACSPTRCWNWCAATRCADRIERSCRSHRALVQVSATAGATGCCPTGVFAARRQS